MLSSLTSLPQYPTSSLPESSSASHARHSFASLTDDMKSALVFLALAGSALAQGVAIFAPAVDAPVTAGSDLVVDVEKKVGEHRLCWWATR